MCDPRIGYAAQQAQANVSPKQKPDAAAAARDLARLMERQLGYPDCHIDQIALRLFIRAYWTRVSTYAHTIHEESA